MGLVTGKHPMAREICKALGLDPALVHELIMFIRVNDVTQVDVAMYPDEQSVGDIAKLLDKRFRLVEVQEGAE